MQRSRAARTDAANLRQNMLQALHVSRLGKGPVWREAHGNEAAAWLHLGGHGGRNPVHIRSLALLGDEHLIADRIVNDTYGQFTLDRKRDGYTVEREPVHEIGCTVNRIDNPEVLMLPPFLQRGRNRICAGRHSFFPKDGMVGIMGQDQPPDHLLHTFINFSNQILRRRLAAQFLHLSLSALDPFPRLGRSVDCRCRITLTRYHIRLPFIPLIRI
ncbi:hypothetical protein D3C73_1141600 [compost metagenome]